MVVLVKIVGYAGLGVGQVGKNRPLAEFEHLGFEPGPEAFRLRIIVAVAASALRAQGSVLAEQGTVGLPQYYPPYRVRPRSEWTSKPGVGSWAKKARCKTLITSSLRILAPTCQPTMCFVSIA
jgi:hypothetical protein